MNINIYYVHKNFYFGCNHRPALYIIQTRKKKNIYIYSIYNIIKGKQVCVCIYTCIYIYIYIFWQILPFLCLTLNYYNCLLFRVIYIGILYCIVLYYIILPSLCLTLNYHNSSCFSMISLEIDAPTAKECTTTTTQHPLRSIVKW